MVTANRYDQTTAIRNNSTDSFKSSVTPSPEDALTAYRISRDRIRQDREAEIARREAKRRESIVDRVMRDPLELAREKVQEKVQEKIEKVLPFLKPINTVLKEATNRQLEIQNLLAPTIKTDSCGVSIQTPFIKYHYIDPDCLPPAAKPDPPFQTPDGQGRANFNRWNALARSKTSPTTITLAWNYTGWVYEIWQKNSPVGITAIHNNQGAADGTTQPQPGLYDNIWGVTIANPELTGNVYAVSSNPVNFTAFFYTTGRYLPGYDPDIPTPTQSAYQVDLDAENQGFTSQVLYRNRYRSFMRLNSSLRINTSVGVRWHYNVTMNFRVDLTISGDWSTYDANLTTYLASFPSSANDFFRGNAAIAAEYAILARFEAPQRIFLLEANRKSQFCQGINPPMVIEYNLPEARIKPPPPPPKEKCDCMANCCPQNQYDLSELRRLIRIVIRDVNQVKDTQEEHEDKLGLDIFPIKIPGYVEAKSNSFQDRFYAAAAIVFINNPILGSAFGQTAANFLATLGVKIKPEMEIKNMAEYIAWLTATTGDESSKSIDYIGTPVEMALWDTDPNKPGNQQQKIKPNTLFKAIEAVMNEVTLTQRIIGIDKLPAKVPKKWVSADNTYKMMQAVAKQMGVQGQFEFLKQLVGIGEAQAEITSLVEFLDWQSDQLDDVLGDWEIKVNIADGDLIKPGEQGTEAYMLNVAQAMGKIYEESAASHIGNKAIINMLTRVLIEFQGVKQVLGKSASQVDAIRDYLGFPTATEIVKVPAHCNVPKPIKDGKEGELTTVDDLGTFLEGTSLSIETEVYKEKGTYQDILVDLQQAAAITRAKDYQRVGSPKDMALLLGGLATAYGLLKPKDGGLGSRDGKLPPDNFEAFCEAVENDFAGVTGRVSDTPDQPYGKPRKNRPRIREIGKDKGFG